MSEFKSRIMNVGIFKNGLSVITQEITVPSAGNYYLDDIPKPIHGTYWLESEADVSCRITYREKHVSLETATIKDLIDNQMATICMSSKYNGLHEIYCRIIRVVSDRNMHRDKTFLLVHLDQDGEYMLIDQTQIESIRLSGLTEAIIQQHPVLVLTVKTEGTARILIRYISHGMVWSPAYKVDTTNPSTLKLLQQAVVKNEMCDLENTDIELISGFPNFEFRSVVSLFSTITTEDFFNNLEHRKGGNLDRDQCTMTTYSSADDYAGTDIGEATSKSVDLYIYGIGKYNLKLNDAILEKLAEGESLYRRVVEWLVLDTREPDGQFAPQILYKQQARAYEEGAWDSLIFSNPFDHPMTAAPVEIVENDRFRGQSLTYWVNPGEEVLLRVTKALSIKTRSIEQEEPDTRNTLEWGGYKFQGTKVKGQLFLANRRKEGADILIRRRFTGELDYADEKPEMKILDEGTVSINPRNELRWSVHLAGGAEINLNYSYIVMVKIEH